MPANKCKVKWKWLKYSVDGDKIRYENSLITPRMYEFENDKDKFVAVQSWFGLQEGCFYVGNPFPSDVTVIEPEE